MQPLLNFLDRQTLIEAVKYNLMHSTKKANSQTEDYIRHKFYLRKIKTNSLFCPRYDMLSLHNNLLLHRNYDPKLELCPRRQSSELKAIELQIMKKQVMKGSASQKPKTRWFESALTQQQPKQGKFKCEYWCQTTPESSVRDQLNRIYSIRRKSSNFNKTWNILSK